MKTAIAAAIVVGGTLMSIEARADNYDESVQGDLSNVNTAPTPINLTVGVNKLTGSTGTANGSQVNGIDRDYFTVTVPAGTTLHAIRQVGYSMPNGGVATNVTFFGVQNGATFTDPGSTTAAQLLGYVLFGLSSTGIDVLLPDMGHGIDTATGTSTFGTPIGFLQALGPGTYTFWIQDDTTQIVDYQFEFVVSGPVPAMPVGFVGALGLGIAAAGAWAMRGSRRRPVATLA